MLLAPNVRTRAYAQGAQENAQNKSRLLPVPPFCPVPSLQGWAHARQPRKWPPKTGFPSNLHASYKLDTSGSASRSSNCDAGSRDEGVTTPACTIYFDRKIQAATRAFPGSVGRKARAGPRLTSVQGGLQLPIPRHTAASFCLN